MIRPLLELLLALLLATLPAHAAEPLSLNVAAEPLSLNAAAEPLVVHVFAGQQLLGTKEASGAGLVRHLLGAWRDPAGWRLVPHPVDSLAQFRQEVRDLPPEPPSDPGHPRLLVAMLTSRVLEAASAEQMLAIAGHGQPFADIDEQLKGRDRLRRDRIDWLPLGWVLWSSFDALRPPGGCAPSFTWTTCIAPSGPDAYTISQRAGERGWPLYGAAVLRPDGARSDRADANADALMDFLASAAASEILRADFVVVPYPAVRARRSVVFNLYEATGPALLATSYDSPHPLPRPAIDPVTGTFNVCGRNGICPNYRAPPGTEDAMRGKVTAALGGG